LLGAARATFHKRVSWSSAARFEHRDLAFDFHIRARAAVAEKNSDFDFRFRAEFSAPRRRTLTLASPSQRALFHIAIAHFGVEQDLLERRQ